MFTLVAAGLAGEFGAEGMGCAIGLSMFFLPLGSLSPFFVARAQETTGSYFVPIMSMAALVIAAGALSLLLRERARSSEAPLSV